MRVNPVVFRHFPGLVGKVPWVSLGEFPTPIHHLNKLGAEINLSQLYCKRDDLSHPEYGGNKIRKLEFLLADAKRLNRNAVLTVGAWGSNHILAVTIMAKKLGLKPFGIMIPQCPQEYARKNLLANFALGAELNFAQNILGAGIKISRIYLGAWRKGMRPYFIWAGGSTPVGALGYVNAGLEIAHQVREGALPEPDYLFCAVGSCGTFVGLVLGLMLSGLKTKVIGIRVYDRSFANSYVSFQLAQQTLKLMRKYEQRIPNLNLSLKQFTILHSYAGSGYAVPTPEGIFAVEKARELEGLHLDTTYTGKCLAGIIDLARKGDLNNKVVLFLNSFNSRPLEKLVSSFPDWHNLPREFHHCFIEKSEELKK